MWCRCTFQKKSQESNNSEHLPLCRPLPQVFCFLLCAASDTPTQGSTITFLFLLQAPNGSSGCIRGALGFRFCLVLGHSVKMKELAFLFVCVTNAQYGEASHEGCFYSQCNPHTGKTTRVQHKEGFSPPVPQNQSQRRRIKVKSLRSP